MNFFIETLNQWGGDVSGFAWPMFWQSSLLIAILFTADWLLRRKLRASVRYTLWLVVLVKLCLPPTFALPTSPSWWLHKSPPPPVVAKPKIQNYTVTYDQGPLMELPQTPLPAYEPPKPAMTKTAWLLVICASGSVVLLVWMLVRWWQIARLVRRATATAEFSEVLTHALRLVGAPVSDPARSSLILKRAGSETGVPTVRLKIVEGQMSPAVCGLFRPVILLPRCLAERLSAGQLRAVLLHELIHLRRRDVWVNFIQTLLQIAYWWHPLVWVANARIRRVREEAVDDAVMLALRDEAETYAPTLLEVAKLALNRPLAALGLVGILESRSALRQRIERLVDFHPPRQAGLTLVSLLGILAFTAVAVPMGEGPAPVAKSNATDAVAAEEQSLTIRVDPEIFFRNLKAQAANVMLSPTNDWGEILMELLRDEGVDCNPPHGLAFTNATGDLTTQNTPERLEVFSRVVEQLNRADGICELPLGDNPLRKNVLIEGRIYPMSDGEFDKFTSGLHRYSAGSPGEEWWSVPPETFKQFVTGVEASGLELIQRPRIQTGSGIKAWLYVGDRTNGFELICKPLVGKGFVDLALESTVVSGAPMNAVTNHVFSKAAAEDRGGIVLRMANYGGHAGSNLVAVISTEIVTNAARFQDRLAVVIHRAGSTNSTSTNVTVGTVTGLLADPNFRMVIHALEQRSGTETLVEPEVVTTSGRSINRITMTNLTVPVANTASQSTAQLTRTFRLDHPPRSEELKAKLLAAGVQMPPTVFYYNYNGVLFVRGSEEQLARVNQLVMKLNGYSADEIETVGSGSLPATNASSMNEQTLSQLFSRTYKVDPNVFATTLRNTPGLPTNTVSALARSLFSQLGVDWESPKGKSVFYNDKPGKLFVKATVSDLDTIEQVIQTISYTPPQIHIKARFVEVPKGTMSAFGQFPGPTNSPTGGFTGILSDTNARVMLRTLESRKDVKILAEPEVVTTSGRQTQMRATQVQTMVTNFVFQETETNQAIVPQSGAVETGPILDVVPYVLSDGYTINLSLIPSLTEFLGYDKSTNTTAVYNRAGEKIDVPIVLPRFSVRQVATTLNLWDNQTAVISGIPEAIYVNGSAATRKQNARDKELLVFITATIVDPAGNRVHADDELPFAQKGFPPQPVAK